MQINRNGTQISGNHAKIVQQIVQLGVNTSNVLLNFSLEGPSITFRLLKDRPNHFFAQTGISREKGSLRQRNEVFSENLDQCVTGSIYVIQFVMMEDTWKSEFLSSWV